MQQYQPKGAHAQTAQSNAHLMGAMWLYGGNVSGHNANHNREDTQQYLGRDGVLKMKSC